ncbi:hybrid sensor histidine kinase/response regulator [Pedobacter alpinus]|uniref:histidine kinase n=2 Tax=Pedobacter alpinus TaxID=1590643 RepID=A0ABW5TP47_9SPHI
MKPVKVLLVDDDEDDFILTKDIFNEIPQRENYKLTWINNYEEAINAMLKSHYDIYLVDYRLGKYTGIDLLHEAIKSNVDEPIIILTGKGDSKVDEEALEIGAADYLVKDQINPYTIERSIRYALKHKHTLKALRESENKFRIIFERSKEPFLIMDSLGGIRDMNQAGLKFLSYSKEEILNVNGVQLFSNPDDSLRFTEEIDQKGAINDFKTDFISKTHENKKVSVSAFLQIDQHATEELYYCIVHDIAGRIEAEKASIDAEKIAVTERIAKSLANEITNPLSNINLSLEQLKLEISTEDDSSKLYLDIIKNNFERINILITDFINSTQTTELNIQPRALSILLDECLETIEISANEHQIKLIKDYSDSDIFVDVDYDMMVNAISNILNNSVAAQPSFISINFKLLNAFVVVEIQDDGEGISVDNQSKIYEPFFTTKGKSSGLGLTNTQKSIINHNGKIEFESKEGEGTTFYLHLPISNKQVSWDN